MLGLGSLDMPYVYIHTASGASLNASRESQIRSLSLSWGDREVQFFAVMKLAQQLKSLRRYRSGGSELGIALGIGVRAGGNAGRMSNPLPSFRRMRSHFPKVPLV